MKGNGDWRNKVRGERMKWAGLVLCCISVCAQTHAQELRFQAPPSVDSSVLSNSIRELALEALSQQQEPQQDSDLRNKFLFQLAAGQYAESVSSFAASRAQHRAQVFDRGILLELYAKTKAVEAEEHLAFEKAFGWTFAAVFRELDDRTALDSEYFLETPLGV